MSMKSAYPVMPRHFLCLLSTFVFVGAVTTAHADHHLKLSDELKPLQFLVGDWVLEREGDDGVKTTITTSSRPDAQGHVLRTSGQWHRDGELRVSWFTLRYKKHNSQDITTINVVSNGSRHEGSTSSRDGMLVTKSEGTNANGDKVSFETHVKMVDQDTITSQRMNIVVNGEARDNWPVGNYKRK